MSTSDHKNAPGVEQTTWKQPAGNEPTDATKATMVEAESVEGQTVLMDQSSAEHVRADRVTLNMSKASSIEASSVQMEKSAAVSVEAEKAAMQESAAVHIDAGHLRMVKSSSLVAQSNELTMEEGATALLVITGGLRGEARALVTVPAAAIIGAIFAVLAAMLFTIVQGSRK